MASFGESANKVSGACDSCRRRKLKCSGSQPCDRCDRDNIACTFGRTLGRTTTADYVRHLENRVAELHTLLEQRTQAIETLQQSDEPEEIDGNTRDRLISTFIRPEDDYILMSPQRRTSAHHGRYGGLSALRIVRNLCDNLCTSASVNDHTDGAEMAEAFDNASLDLPFSNDIAAFALLPSYSTLNKTISHALDVALSCKECLDRDELWTDIQRLYARDPEDYKDADKSLLALVYALMALGKCYEPHDNSNVQSSKIEMKGLSYFRASKTMVTSMGYVDLNTVRTTICLSMFLMSSSMASKAHSMICVGASAALRLGLHISGATFKGRLSTFELTQRRRTFAVLYLLDTIISSTLGMPLILRDANLGQILPLPEDHPKGDNEASILENPWSPVAETLVSAKIYRVLGRIIKSRFPIPDNYDGQEAAYNIDRSQVAHFATDLEALQQQMPQNLPLATDRRALLAQLYLRLQHAGVQLILYRPFLVHVVCDKYDSSFDPDGYAFGSSGLKAAIQLVKAIEGFHRHGFLHEAQWFVIFFLALAATSLSYFVLSAQQDSSAEEIEECKTAALRSNQMLRSLATKSLTAKRCLESLAPVMSHLQGSSTVTPSPRTQFMRAIGAEREA